MSQIKTLNGVQYTLPQYNDIGWGANTGNVLTQYIAAIADVTLQLSGGAFTLTAETDFGANFGLKALYLKSETANPASAGVLRLAKTDSVKWRNNANGADIALAIDGSDNLTFSGTKVILSGLIVNADVASGAAIVYSKLSLTGSIVNADVNASAAIAYSKLALTGSVVNADIGASAAIALSKLAALGANKALTSDASGFIVANPGLTTDTELGYVHGVTSAIQTQLGTKAAIAGQQFTGNISFDSASHGIVGVVGGGSAASGNIGEVIESKVGAGSAVNAAGNNTATDITNIPLTAGIWSIAAVVQLATGTATFNSGSYLDAGMGTASGTSATGFVDGDTFLEVPLVAAATNANPPGVSIPAIIVRPSTSTTYYLKFRAGYASGTPTAYGRITATRVG